MKNMTIKIVVMLFVLSFVLTFLMGSALYATDTYPNKPVRLIIPFGPGGNVDIVGRLVAGPLSERLGQRVFIDNRPGGGGVVGSEIVAKADPDGYTLLFTALFFATTPAFHKLPYDPVKSFTAIAKVGTGTNVLAVNSSVTANSVKEFIELVKQKPGQLIAVTGGVGTSAHLSAELFKIKTGLDFKIVHFRSSGFSLTDMLGGHSHFTISSILPVIPHLKSGKLRALGIAGARRSAMLPEVETITEAGIAGYDVSGWWGVIAPSGLPEPIVDKLSKEIKSLLAIPKVQKMLFDQGGEVDYLNPAEFGLFVKEEIARWGNVVKEANIKIK